MAPSSSSRGRVVPLSVPISTSQLGQLRLLRARVDHIQKRIEKLNKLEDQLKNINDEPRWDVLVPLASSTSLAYAKGSVKDTNTVLVHFEHAAEEENNGDQVATTSTDGHKGYWVEYSAKQAIQVAKRRQAHLMPKLDKLAEQILKAETALSSEMGFNGGRLNDNFELVNEEGLPFVDIQEFEEDEAPPVASTSSVPAVASAGPASQAKATPADVASQAESNAANTRSESIKATVLSPTTSTVKPRKSVSFASKDEYEPDKSGKSANEEEHLPIIASQKAAASAGLPKAAIAPTIESESTPITSATKAPLTSTADSTMKGKIVEKEITKPPPVLTAAERSARKPTKWDVVADMDGRDSEEKKIDLSAYLPKSLRGVPIKATFKGKARADNVGTMDAQPAEHYQLPSSSTNGSTAHEDEDGMDQAEEDAYDYADNSDDSEYYEEDLQEDSDEENIHIDDILAMREASMEYHAKRHSLGAGAGMGPLGGYGRPEDFEEPGLTEFEKGGLPIVESYENEDGSGQRQPSRFRKSRLETAAMVIPDLQPGDKEISESLLPGDSLGPFEDEDTADPGQHGTNDFRGMSKEEIETFLRYVKALETGEDLQDLRVIPAGGGGAGASFPGAGPPAVKETVRYTAAEDTTPAGPSIKDSVIEKTSTQNLVTEKVPETLTTQQEEKPKRVSRFRAAKGTT